MVLRERVQNLETVRRCHIRGHTCAEEESLRIPSSLSCLAKASMPARRNVCILVQSQCVGDSLYSSKDQLFHEVRQFRDLSFGAADSSGPEFRVTILDFFRCF